MKKQLISFKTAKLAKEKGFPQDSCLHVYDENGKQSRIVRSIKENEIDAPTQSVLQKWLREKYNCHIYIEPIWNSTEEAKDPLGEPNYMPWVIFGWIEEDEEEEYYETYEEALEAGLKQALKLI